MKRCLLYGMPILACLVDSYFTFSGQLPEYWAGDFSKALERNPMLLWTLQIHPAVILLMGTLWMGIVIKVINTLPVHLGIVFSVSVTLGHLLAALSWAARWH